MARGKDTDETQSLGSFEKEQGADDEGVTGGRDLSTTNKKRAGGAGGPKGPEECREKVPGRELWCRGAKGGLGHGAELGRARSLTQGVWCSAAFCCAAPPRHTETHKGTPDIFQAPPGCTIWKPWG
ncbi:hypothetical protein NDU88_006429 [Pleurodeles waltl]|uniref:Uncharacterized protein n=1 Tax=Pleurodeles waltl TaxID=8319 RepID=A0AAV7WXK1_PLEWA|nr:hypothetical protein NDU88_006429 [Pleurodeles waltl]